MLSALHSQQRTAAASLPTPPVPASILYAEDDTVVRGLTTRILVAAGYHITAVDNGLAAWEALQSRPFDLLITDNDMPQLAGIELVTKLRRAAANLPIILASGSAGFFSEKQFHWLNFTACIQKPFAPDDLLHAVNQALTNR